MELIVLVAILRFACADVSHLFNNQIPRDNTRIYGYTSQYTSPVNHYAETKVIPQYSVPEKAYDLNLESTNLNSQLFKSATNLSPIQTFQAPTQAHYESAQTKIAPLFAPAPSYHTLAAPNNHYSPEIHNEVAQFQFIPQIAPVRTSYQTDAYFSSSGQRSPIHHELAQTQFIPQVVPASRQIYHVPAASAPTSIFHAPTYHSSLPVYNAPAQAHPVAAHTQVFPQIIPSPAYHVSAASTPTSIYHAPAHVNDAHAHHHHHQHEAAQTQFIQHVIPAPDISTPAYQAPSSVYHQFAQTQIIPHVVKAPEVHFAAASVPAPKIAPEIDYQTAATSRTGFLSKDGYHYLRY